MTYEIDAEGFEDLIRGEVITVGGIDVKLDMDALSKADEIGAQVYRDGVDDHIAGKYAFEAVDDYYYEPPGEGEIE